VRLATWWLGSGGVGQNILEKNASSHCALQSLGRSKTKKGKGREISAITPENRGIYAVQLLTLPPKL